MTTLEELYQEIKSCKNCNLWQYATQAVLGEGPQDAKIMIIGEAPGREEDRAGRPFEGRAGKLLRKTLDMNGLNSVYITNVVKHRPPNNRKPKKDEIETCSKFLLEEIKIVKPKVIIALGSTASKFLTGEEKINVAFEKEYKFMGIKVIVDYHPAAVLRNPRLYYKFKKKINEAYANL